MIHLLKTTALVLAACLTLAIAQGEDVVNRKSISDLIADLDERKDRNAADVATRELGQRGKDSIPALTALIHDKTAIGRHRAVISLGIAKDLKTVPLLLECLKDHDWHVRGRAAYSLSQIDCQASRDAIVGFLEKCIRPYPNDDRVNLTFAAEALQELPDERAFPLLMSLISADDTKRLYPGRYAAIALGKIGNPQASEALAQLLNSSVPYDRSWDYIYIKAISQTKGESSVPYLIRYLGEVANRIAKHPKYNPHEIPLGADYRQRQYDSQIFSQTCACLEAVTRTKSEGANPSAIADFWSRYTATRNETIEKRGPSMPD